MFDLPVAPPASRVDTKRCYLCHTARPIHAFAFRNKAIGVRQGHCRPCHAAYRRQHYLDHRDEYIGREVDRIRTRRNHNRALLVDFLRTHACVDCGESDPVVLEFDHRDPSTKVRDISYLVVRKPWPAVLKEMAKCDVRCANCHRIRTRRQQDGRHAIGSMPSMPRRCIDCGCAAGEDEFPIRDRVLGIRRNQCRGCRRAYLRRWYRDSRRTGTRHTGSLLRARAYARSYLEAHPCADCGASDPEILDFDHVDPSAKVLEVAELIRQGRDAEVRIEIGKCEIRCVNCHRRRTARESGWHKLRLTTR